MYGKQCGKQANPSASYARFRGPTSIQPSLLVGSAATPEARTRHPGHNKAVRV